MKIKYVLGLAISSLLFLSSCSDSMMDKINTDEQHPSLPTVDGKFQITDGEVATVYRVLCGNYAWYVSSFTEQEFGTNNNQLKDVEARLLHGLRDPVRSGDEGRTMVDPRIEIVEFTYGMIGEDTESNEGNEQDTKREQDLVCHGHVFH